MSDEEDAIKREAVARHELHKLHPSHRPLSVDYELVGLRGEQAASEMFDVPIDMMRRPSGDGGTDHIVPLIVNGLPMDCVVDVKTACKPYNLIVEVGKVKPQTIYILAGYAPQHDRAYLLGWEWGVSLANAPSKDFGYGVINHYIPRENLRDIEELTSRKRRT